MIKIPNTDKKWIQTNKGNILGNLWATFGIDLMDAPGAIRLGNRMKIVGKTGDSGLTNMGVPVAFTPFSSQVYHIGGSRIFFEGGLHPDMTITEDASTNARTDWSCDTDDLCGFNGTLVGMNCTQGKLYSLDSSLGGTWTTRSTVAGGGSNGQLREFPFRNRLYVSSANNIHSVDTGWNISTTGGTYDIALTAKDDGGFIQTFECASDKIWIGMKRGGGGTTDNSNPKQFCSIYDWDGVSNTFTKEYKIPAQGVMSIIMNNDIPIILDTEGVFRQFNGQGFIEVGRLPLKRNESLLVQNNATWTQNFIHPRGLAMTKDNTVLALINNRPLTNYSSSLVLYENLPSGIWECDLKGSVNHKHPLTLMPMSSTTVTDYGQNRISLIGSLASIKLASISAYGISTLFAGAQYYTDASSTKSALFLDAPTPTLTSTYPEGQKYGQIITTWIESPIVEDTWKKIYPVYRKFLDSGDKMVLKYRLSPGTSTMATITWVNTTSFTTTTDVSALTGYEVEIVQGIGSGKCSHVTSVVNNAGTYTVTLDETYTGATTTTAIARFQNWKKIIPAIAEQSSDFKRLSIDITSAKLQIKVCMQFTGNDELYSLLITSVSPATSVQYST